MSMSPPLILLAGAACSSPSLASLIDLTVPVYSLIVLAVLYASYKEDPTITDKHANTTSLQAPAPAPAPPPSSTPSPPVDLSGSYKLTKNTNYQKFLEVQGVGWALRKAADGANATQTITHSIPNKTLTLKVASLLTFQLDYIMDSPPMATTVKDKNFMDTATYLPSGGIIITKRNEKDKYTIFVKRELSADGKVLSMSQDCKCDNGKGATAGQTFERVN